MFNVLTRSLGLGEIQQVSEYERLTDRILNDSLLYKRLIQMLTWQYGPEIIAQMHPLERDAFKKRIQFNAPTPRIRVVWEFVAAEKTGKWQRSHPARQEILRRKSDARGKDGVAPHNMRSAGSSAR